MKDQNSDVDHLYCGLKFEEFGLHAHQYDFYFRIRNTKYLPIQKNVSLKDLDPKSSNKNRFIYLKTQDYVRLLKFKEMESLTSPAPSSATNEESPWVQEMPSLNAVLRQTLSEIMGKATPTENAVFAKILVTNTLSVLFLDERVLEKLAILLKRAPKVFVHSIGVSYYSVLLGQGLQLSQKDLLKIALGGLLHDIGKYQIPSKILSNQTHLNQPRPEGPCERRSERGLYPAPLSGGVPPRAEARGLPRLDEEEQALLQRHPIEGAKTLIAYSTIPLEVISIVHQHHENTLGTGYPFQIAADKIHPWAKLVGLMNEFCHQIQTEKGFGGIPLKAAFDQWSKNSTPPLNERFDPAYLEALAALLC